MATAILHKITLHRTTPRNKGILRRLKVGGRDPVNIHSPIRRRKDNHRYEKPRTRARRAR
ncbi:hypothetical protein ASPCAL05675 [Aspergillus calidoustus]|uniref:Uncharacterized protein n=1 Tax=Aspergillus calidoustus TaxID=454130 RepID=A0A0U5FYV4_ASPCI|nr:hypothetical protein ASPCAL05675 [Aspergillus calidoustus]